MTTPTHMLLSLAVLGRKSRPQEHKWLLLGGFLPDAVIFWFFLWEGIVKGASGEYLWDELYFTPFWQAAVDYWNSIPLLGLCLGLAVWKRLRWLQALSLSMLLHVLGDIFVHNDDAHAHFLPLTNWKFVSPVSYYDPAHYGQYFVWVELLLIGACVYFAERRLNSPRAKKWLRILGFGWFALLLIGNVAQLVLV